MKKLIILPIIFFLLTLTSYAENKSEKKETTKALFMSAGVLNGNVMDYYPNTKILRTFPNSYSGSAGNLYLINNNININDFLLDTNFKSMSALLDGAKEKCKEYYNDGVIFYGVSNFRFDFQITDNMVVYFATGDIYCAR